MAIENDDGTLGLADWEWEIERSNMARFGYLNLRDCVTCTDSQGQPFAPDETYVRKAISQMELGLDRPDGALVHNLGEFQAARATGRENRGAMMQAALDHLCEAIGFTPGWTVVETVELQGDPDPKA